MTHALEQPALWLGEAPVVSNREEAPGYWWMRLHVPAVAAAAGPGQFVHIRTSSADNPLLRRPMSIGRVDRAAGTVDILYKVVGTGTRLMAAARPGDALDILGPLGTSFSFPAGVRRAALLGRGVGVAPLIFWGMEAAARGIEVWAFFSARSEAMIFGPGDLEPLGVRVFTGADDGGSRGSNGLLEAFAGVCKNQRIEFALTCGSRRQARLIGRLARELGLRGEVSLEAQMGCGMGACRGCACTVADGEQRRYALVCQEGPVFPTGWMVHDEA